MRICRESPELCVDIFTHSDHRSNLQTSTCCNPRFARGCLVIWPFVSQNEENEDHQRSKSKVLKRCLLSVAQKSCWETVSACLAQREAHAKGAKATNGIVCTGKPILYCSWHWLTLPERSAARAWWWWSQDDAQFLYPKCSAGVVQLFLLRQGCMCAAMWIQGFPSCRFHPVHQTDVQ